MAKLFLYIFLSALVFGADKESNFHEIPLNGPIKDRLSEISGMTWYKDQLILLPQYPQRIKGQSNLYFIEKKQLGKWLKNNSNSPISPKEIPIHIPQNLTAIENYQGFEAICFHHNHCFMIVEQHHKPTGTMGAKLVRGKLVDGEIYIDEYFVSLPMPKTYPNMGYESMAIYNDRIILFHEINSKQLNPESAILCYDFDLKPVENIPMPETQFRLTDMTEVIDNQFWAINFFWNGERKWFQEYCKKEQVNDSFMQLLSYNLTAQKVVQNPSEIIIDMPDNQAYNFEGLVRYKSGFLIITDKYPRTVFGLVSIKKEKE